MRLNILPIALLLGLLSACVSTPNVPVSGTEFRLSGCPPLINCVSSESEVGLYFVEPFRLTEGLDQISWDRIKAEALALPGASLSEERFGYLELTCYSKLFHFPDVVELLVDDSGRMINVRSQSLLGIYDLGANRARVEVLRSHLEAQGLVVRTE
ncbi:DUF1499 domain-containing protein [Marinobacter caseinilyticus]|uniref:DUF1499 domain-containing protein n=1 Tax=Marinobacter caseinilyticus TaxID=2692195 RepID=UPI001407F3B4|nr:DUF1499 domain-containing protein [Marinobacter caseinilyticus]